MIDTRQALTAYLAGAPELAALGAIVVQEHELTKDTPVPAVVLAFDYADPLRDSARLTRERWNLWAVAGQDDFYTVGALAKALRGLLHRRQIPGTAGGSVIEFEWIWSGRAEADKPMGLTAQLQRYWALTQANP